jgi:hypothetical protein
MSNENTPVSTVIINDINLPDPIFTAMSKDTYVRLGDHSPSSLKCGIREYIGGKRFKGFRQLASNAWPAFSGTLMHIGLQVLLKDDPRYQQEISSIVSFNEVAKSFKLEKDVTISGTCDLLQIDNKVIIWDYKTISTTTLILEDKILAWTIQVNIYMWLLYCTGKIQSLDHLRIIPIFKDWTTTKSGRSRTIEDVPCLLIEATKLTRYDIEKYIYDKVSMIQKYENAEWNEIPYCSMHERWEKESSWSICKMQPTGKLGRALDHCTFLNKNDATVKLEERTLKAKKDEKFEIRRNGGIPRNCLTWCSMGINSKCDFVEKHYKKNEGDEE